MFIVAKICGPGALPYPPWACLLGEIHDSSYLNKAHRQVVTDRHAERFSNEDPRTNLCGPPPHASVSQMMSCLIDFIYLTRGSIAV